MAGAGLPVSIAWPQLAQAHGQVQALGYTLLFILAVGLQLFPRFLGAPLLHVQRAPWGASLVALALVARLVGQPLARDGTRHCPRFLDAGSAGRHADGGLGIPRFEPSVCAA